MKGFTQWLYRQSSFMGALVKPILPMQQPTTYTGIRAYALSAFKQFRAEADAQEIEFTEGMLSPFCEVWVTDRCRRTCFHP